MGLFPGSTIHDLQPAKFFFLHERTQFALASASIPPASRPLNTHSTYPRKPQKQCRLPRLQTPPPSSNVILMGHHQLSRREILEAIPILGSGSLLLPLSGQRPDTRTPGVIRGTLRDGATGQPVAAKIRVTNTASGEAYFPANAIKTMPQRAQPGVKHYFYARGSYEVAVPPGRYQIEVVRGICHEAAIAETEVGAGITHVHDLRIPVLRDLRASGWYSGNTHTHYHLEIDEDPDDR